MIQGMELYRRACNPTIASPLRALPGSLGELLFHAPDETSTGITRVWTCILSLFG
ncbi:hypothetical protein [Alkalispirochaeta alkalica]|uniref:hypothetical protein n=1 Tax=Alkalispirochaeta alkalica TaxID=46356 RepID=UPI0003A8EE11|nr:hypothetical protein [Alkalispirochaeta alkalica]